MFDNLMILDEKITLEYGAGGRATARLIDEVFKPFFANDILGQGDDAAVFPALSKSVTMGKIAFTTDTHVVTPLFFKGGDIGALAVNGTVNDLAVMGARPLYLSAGFVIEEGLPFATLQRIAKSMGAAAEKAGVKIVTGDTKVVEKGAVDGVFINTAGVGLVPAEVSLAGNSLAEGDVIIVSGTLGEHAVAILAARKNMEFEVNVASDTAALNGLTADMLAVGGIKAMRDATRGGLAAVLNELAAQSGVGMMIDEAAVPFKKEVLAVCDMFGYDPLALASEGRLVAVVKAEKADAVLAAMRANPLGKSAAIIGKVVRDKNNFVQMRTKIGGERLVEWIWGEQLPRIC